MTYEEILQKLKEAREAIERKTINFPGSSEAFNKLSKAHDGILLAEIYVAEVDDELKKGA
jgi:hypothetical protein